MHVPFTASIGMRNSNVQTNRKSPTMDQGVQVTQKDDGRSGGGGGHSMQPPQQQRSQHNMHEMHANQAKSDGANRSRQPRGKERLRVGAGRDFF